eukprot:gene13414-28446_t
MDNRFPQSFDPSTLPLSSTENYKLFFDQREEIKKQSYEKVIWFGWVLLATGLILGCVPLILGITTLVQAFPRVVIIIINVVLLLAAFIVDCGLLIVSTVPTDKLNIDMIANRMKNYRLVHSIFGIFFLVLGIYPNSFAKGIPIESIKEQYTAEYSCEHVYNSSTLIAGSLCFILLGYIAIFAFGITAIVNGLLIFHCDDFSPYAILLGVILVMLDIVVLIIGSKRVFTFMAARFEYDIDRLQRDGAFMAELVATTGVINEGDIRF